MDISSWIGNALASGKTSEDIAQEFISTLNKVEKNQTKKQEDQKRNNYMGSLYQKAQTDMKLGGNNVTDTTLAGLATYMFMKKNSDASKEVGEKFYKNVVDTIYNFGDLLVGQANGNACGAVTKIVKNAFEPLKVEIENLTEVDVENAIEKFLREFHIW